MPSIAPTLMNVIHPPAYPLNWFFLKNLLQEVKHLMRSNKLSLGIEEKKKSLFIKAGKDLWNYGKEKLTCYAYCFLLRAKSINSKKLACFVMQKDFYYLKWSLNLLYLRKQMLFFLWMHSFVFWILKQIDHTKNKSQNIPNENRSASRELENTQFAIFEQYLLDKGEKLTSVTHHPYGESIFPDFKTTINGKIIYVEMTSVEADIEYEGKRYGQDKHSRSSKNMLSDINMYISLWLPPEYVLILDLRSPLLTQNGRSKLAKKIAKYFKEKFESNTLSLTEKDLECFSNDLKISSAMFIKKNTLPKKKLELTFHRRIYQEDVAHISVLFYWSQHIILMHGDEIFRIISSKIAKKNKIIDAKKISDQDEVWLVISLGIGYDVLVCHRAFNGLLFKEIDLEKNFQRILVIVGEEEESLVYELKIKNENNQRDFYLINYSGKKHIYVTTENLRLN